MASFVASVIVTLYRPGGQIVRRESPLILGHGYAAEPANLRRPVVDLSASALWPICQRLVPWCSLLTCPHLTQNGEPICGFYDGGRGWVGVSLDGGAVATLLHECWHALEDRLPVDLITAVDADLGPSIHDADPYFSQRPERRAEAFSAWACRFVEGLPGYTAHSTVDAIFLDAWNGSLGRVLAAT